MNNLIGKAVEYSEENEEKYNLLNEAMDIILQYMQDEEFLDSEVKMFLEVTPIYKNIDIDMMKSLLFSGMNSAANALATEMFKLQPTNGMVS